MSDKSICNGFGSGILINGYEYGFGNISASIAGIPFVGFRGINYSDSTVFENIYGIGNVPIARGRGNYSAECTVTLLKSEIDALVRSAFLQNPNYASLASLPEFDIVVAYLPDNGQALPKIDIIKNCRFMGNSISSNQGDVSIETELTIICSHIKWGQPV